MKHLLSSFQVLCTVYWAGVLARNDVSLIHYDIKTVFEKNAFHSYYIYIVILSLYKHQFVAADKSFVNLNPCPLLIRSR